ncbi:hypothetical protein ACOSP7_027221 [Xanthoceras sorbifolium]
MSKRLVKKESRVCDESSVLSTVPGMVVCVPSGDVSATIGGVCVSSDVSATVEGVYVSSYVTTSVGDVCASGDGSATFGGVCVTSDDVSATIGGGFILLLVMSVLLLEVYAFLMGSGG